MDFAPEEEVSETEPEASEEEIASQLKRYLEEFRQGFLYEVLRWGNDRLLHGGSFLRLVESACGEFSLHGPTGADAASLIFEELFRENSLDKYLRRAGDGAVLKIDPVLVIKAFERELIRNDLADDQYFTNHRITRLVVEFLRLLEKKLDEDSFLANKFRFEFDLFMGALDDGRGTRRLG